MKGRIFDAEKPGGPGIGRAIVKANDATAATDANGQFQFSDIPPGTYRVSLDRRSIGLDRVVTSKMPAIVEVKEGQTAEVQLAVTRSSEIDGKISVYVIRASGAGPAENPEDTFSGGSTVGLVAAGPKAGEDALVESGSLPDVLVEISDGSETLRTLTDAKGDYSFEGIRPGNWKLKVYDNNLPAFHRIENGQRSLALNPGDKKTVDIKVLPMARAMKVIDQGTIELSTERK